MESSVVRMPLPEDATPGVDMTFETTIGEGRVLRLRTMFDQSTGLPEQKRILRGVLSIADAEKAHYELQDYRWQLRLKEKGLVRAEDDVESIVCGPAQLMLHYGFQERVRLTGEALRATAIATIWPLLCDSTGETPNDCFALASYQCRGEPILLTIIYSGTNQKTIGWNSRQWLSHKLWRARAEAEALEHRDLFDFIGLTARTPTLDEAAVALDKLMAAKNSHFEVRGPWPTR